MIPILFIMACAALIASGTSDRLKPKTEKTIIVEECKTYRQEKVCQPEYRRVNHGN